ncbi:hypothetical protein [Photobacterium leiognathi]|nr:hypothetical protein [Photobacterium leiognathi]
MPSLRNASQTPNPAQTENTVRFESFGNLLNSKKPISEISMLIAGSPD